ncbi:AMP-dependent synthetase [Sulfolobales archaeon HS-7]|nr:AMP-dependent synthetase [Sulfolobales archaeon HS-7]
MKLYSVDRLKTLRQYAKENLEEFWEDKAKAISWFKSPVKVLEGEPPLVNWFVGGTTNVSFNAVDRHIPKLKNRVAFYYTNEKGEDRGISYGELYRKVNGAAAFLRELGVSKGDTVSLMMPSSPEAVIWSLAIHRLGAILVIHYIGLSEETLAYRLKDSNSRFFITTPKTIRGGNEINIKGFVDKVLERENPIEKVIVVPRKGDELSLKAERDVVGEYVDEYVSPVEVEANHPLTIYYTSGTTGRPKGLYHTTAGLPVALNWAFNALMAPTEDDIWWTISELGWPVWPMANLYTIPYMGLTGVLYEGAINYKLNTFASIVRKFGITLIWSSTTSLYTLKALGEESVRGVDTLRMILNTGETLNPGAWDWLVNHLPGVTIGDAYWMTEHLLPLAATPYGLGEIPFKPGSAGTGFPGSEFAVVDDDGTPLPPDRKGYIVLTLPNPAMAKMWNDPSGERLQKSYWLRFPGRFYTGDFGYYDDEGYLYVLGRADDVITAEGSRIGTMEIEGILAKNPRVAEVAVSGTKDGKIIALIVPRGEAGDVIANELKDYVRNSGSILHDVRFVKRLPKTKSGKIMRRLIRAVANREEIGDISTLDDISSLEEIKRALGYE